MSMDTEALVAWAHNNAISEKDCHVLQSREYTGRFLLEREWKLVKDDLFKDRISRNGEDRLRKAAAEINDPRPEEKEITICNEGESPYRYAFADEAAFDNYLKNANATGLIPVREEGYSQDGEAHDGSSPPPSPPSVAPPLPIVHTTFGQLKAGGGYTLMDSQCKSYHTLARSVKISTDCIDNLSDSFEQSAREALRKEFTSSHSATHQITCSLADFKRRSGLTPDAMFVLKPLQNPTVPQPDEIVVMEAKMNNKRFSEAQQALKKYEDAVAKYYPGRSLTKVYAPYNLSAEQMASTMHLAKTHSIKILRNRGDALTFELL